MMLLPPAADRCQECATKHDPEMPHNAQSLYYGMAFQMKHGRSPDWLDATAHCSPDMRAQWREHLIGMGVDFDGGGVNPTKKRGK